MGEKLFHQFQKSVMAGVHVPLKKTKTFDPEQSVYADYVYRGKVYHRVCEPLWDHTNTIVVRLNTPIAPELGHNIAVSKRTVKQSGHWCFPRNREKPSILAYSVWGRKEH